jgi:micrococcal nuclease
MNLYNYKAKVLKIIDGDTIDVVIDLGFNLSITQTVRFSEIDTPELHKTKNPLEKTAGIIVKQFLENVILNKEIFVKTIKYDDKYGRYLAEVFTDSGIHINSLLLAKGYANKYDGGTKVDWTDATLEKIINSKGD